MRTAVFAAVTIMVAVMGGRADADNRADSEKLKNEGNALYSSGDYTGAIEKFKASLQADSSYAFAWNNIGMAYYETGEYLQSISHLEQAVLIDSAYAKAYNNLGNALLAVGKYSRAILSYERSVDLQPGIDQKHINIGNALFGMGKYEEAVEAYREALDLNKDSAEAYNNIGVAFQALGDKEKATDAYLYAIRINSRFPDAYINLGSLHYDSGAGDMDKAIYYFDHALKQDSDSVRAMYNMALALYVQGTFTKAMDQLRKAEKADGNNPDIVYAYGRTFAEMENHQMAIRKYEKVLEIAPGYTAARVALSISRAAMVEE